MFYIIYKITNKINSKIYIGKHQTTNLNDSYMGSGKLLTSAIKKYGIDNFQKEILFIFNSEAEMNEKEKELVTEEFCKSKSTYNLNPGGKGGFGFINMNEPLRKRKNKLAMKRAKENGLDSKQKIGFAKYINDKDKRSVASEKRKKTIRVRYVDNAFKSFLGQKHKKETIKKISRSMQGKQVGDKNSQYGSRWITNGVDNKKIKKLDTVPDGWYYGRI